MKKKAPEKSNTNESQISLVTRTEIETDQKGRVEIGKGFSVETIGTTVCLYLTGQRLKTVNVEDKMAFRCFIIELVESGVKQTTLSTVFGPSRQSIHNWINTKKNWGIKGLYHSYPEKRESRKKSQDKSLDIGNKARLLEEERRKKRNKLEDTRVELPFEQEASSLLKQPYDKEHSWEKTRYAGIFVYIIALISHWKWLKLVQWGFGDAYKILWVFLMMSAKNIRSIEQLKNTRTREAGIILGIERLLSRPLLWQWFQNAACLKQSAEVIKAYVLCQLRDGLVGTWLWFTDGHFLPYSGKKKIHYGYNTKRQQVMPGQTNFVTTDEDGRIVFFDIQEGKGNLKERIETLNTEWGSHSANQPVMIFDREGHSSNYFYTLKEKGIPFCCWDKHVDASELKAIADEKYTIKFEMNGKKYGIFEDKKIFKFKAPDKKEKKVTLKLIHLWNISSKKRTCGLASGNTLTLEEFAKAILSRWGASENTFKHIQSRHPYHYHPGFKLVKSDKQDIDNPELKKTKKTMVKLKQLIQKLFVQLAKATPVENSDGTRRKNSANARIQTEIDRKECELGRLKESATQLPPRIDVSTLENYSQFNQIDNEGKNIFDFVTSSIWNARKLLVNQLKNHFSLENEVVDLFYAITDCHGWITCKKTSVIVRLEALENNRRRAAQEKLCSYLTSLGATLPNGKQLFIHVGSNPTG